MVMKSDQKWKEKTSLRIRCGLAALCGCLTCHASALSRRGDSLSLSKPVPRGSSLPSDPGQDWWLWKSYLRQRSKSDRIHMPQHLTLSSPAFSTWVMTLQLSICLTSDWWMVLSLPFFFFGQEQTGKVKYLKNQNLTWQWQKDRKVLRWFHVFY